MNVGIIGYGKMGRIRHNAVENNGGTVTAIYDPNYDNICDVIDKFSVVDDYTKMLHDPSIDAVFICTPNYMNKVLTIESLNANKHVFCEKPPAFNAMDVDEIISVEKRTDRVLMYGFNHRHHESVTRLKDLIETGEYGKVLWMRGRYGKSSTEEFFEGWRSKKELAGGGILIDQGIHMLDLFLYIASDFHDVHAFVSNQYWKTAGVEDNVFAILRNNESGVTASLHSTMTQWRHMFSLEVFLEKGWFALNGLRTSSGTYGPEVLTIAKNRSKAPTAVWSDETQMTYDANTSWSSEIQRFFKCIKYNETVSVGNSGDALKLMRLIDKIYNTEGDKSIER